MKGFNDVLKLFEGFSEAEKKRFVKQIMAMMDKPCSENGCGRMVEEHRNGRPGCPHCRARSELGYIVKRGVNRNGAQRYYCKKCGKIFVAATKTAFEGTRKGADVWSKFIEMTISGESLMDCAVQCEIAYQTAFTWRHKVLNAFKVNQKDTMMTGVVEMDEMMIPISYKGNHMKGKPFNARTRERGEENGLPRKSYRRGTDNKSMSSKDKACVFCMIENDNKSFYAAVPGVGFMLPSMLDKTVAKHTDKASAIILVDQYKVTANYLSENKYMYMTLASNTSDNPHDHKPEIQGNLHLQHVNAMHRHIRRFLKEYCGVATKYLENYISLYIWLKTNQEKKMTKQKHLQNASIARAATSDCYMSRRAIELLPAVPDCA